MPQIDNNYDSNNFEVTYEDLPINENSSLIQNLPCSPNVVLEAENIIPEVIDFNCNSNLLVSNDASTNLLAMDLNKSAGVCDDASIHLLHKLKIENINNVIVSLLNVNSFSSKFDDIKFLIKENVDVAIFVETKIDDSYPNSQFMIDGFTEPFRFDRNRFGGGVIIYVREDIPCRLLRKYELPNDIEAIFLELNFRKSKWLLLGSYHPPSQNDDYYFRWIGSAFEYYNTKYDKCLLAGDFNAEVDESTMNGFLENFGLKSLVKQNTCFKSINNPSCIDLFLTNLRKSFLSTTVISTGISDFHKMAITVMRTTFNKMGPRKIIYRNYKKFNHALFR